jgi:hypothetical protein
MNMDPSKDILQDKRPELKSQGREQWGKLTNEDIARLSTKREEIIMVLQLWHGYGRIRADRAFSNWLYHNSLPHPRRAEDSNPA